MGSSSFGISPVGRLPSAMVSRKENSLDLEGRGCAMVDVKVGANVILSRP